MRGNPYPFSGFQTGINLEAAPYFLDAGQGRDALNVHTSPVGAIVKRPGCSFHADLMTAEPHGVFGCQIASGDKLLIHAGEDFYSNTPNNATVTKLAKAQALTAGYDWEWIQAPESGGQGPFYGVNGKDTPMYWSGEGEVKKWTASAGIIPNGKVIAFWENRVWIASGNTLYWSDITDPRNFESPKGGSTKLDPEDGEEITGLAILGNYLVVTKEHKTFVVVDSNTGAYRRISNHTGCISPRSMITTDAGLMFMTPDREIVITDGTTFNREIATPVNEAISQSNSLRKVCAGVKGSRVFFAIPNASEVNDLILEFDLSNNSWWKHKVYWGEKSSKKIYGGVRQFAILDPLDKETLFALGMGGEGNNEVSWRVVSFMDSTEIYGDNSKAFEWYWISPWHVFTYPHIKKQYREVRVDSKGNYKFYSALSFSNTLQEEEAHVWDIAEAESEETYYAGTGTFGGSGSFGGAAGVITERHFYTLGQGRALSIKFQGEDTYPLEIYAYTIAVNYKKD